MECSICLSDVPMEEEAFLLPICYHRFHKACILRWTEQQQQHPVRDKGEQQCLCPLCKRPYECIVYDCMDKAFKCVRMMVGVHGSPAWAAMQWGGATRRHCLKRDQLMPLYLSAKVSSCRPIRGSSSSSRDSAAAAFLPGWPAATDG